MKFRPCGFTLRAVVWFWVAAMVMVGVLVYVVNGVTCGFGVKSSSLAECGSVCAADVEKIKAELISENPGVSEYLSEKFSCDRKNLFKKLVDFVEKMPVDEVLHGEGLKNRGWDACIEDYLVEFLKKDGGQPNVLNKSDFKKYLNNAGVVPIFRLVDDAKVDRLKNGEVQFDVGVAASYHAGPIRPCGVGLYVAGDEEMAKKVYWIDDKLRQTNDSKRATEKKSGKIVEMALDLKKSKIIDLEKIEKLCSATLIENYAPVISEFKKACELYHMSFGGDAIIHFLNELRSCVEDYGIMGFDYFGHDRKIRKLKLQEKIKSVVCDSQNGGDRLSRGEKINNLLNFGCDVDKLISLFLAENCAFVARVLGYDVVSFSECGYTGNGKSYVVVNPKVLTICRE